MVPDEGVGEVEQLRVDVDLAGVHQEVEAGLEIVAEVEEQVDHFRVEGEDQGVASAPEEVASEGEAESIFYMRAFRGVWPLPRERNNNNNKNNVLADRWSFSDHVSRGVHDDSEGYQCGLSH